MSVRDDPGFRRLWLGTAISAFGTFVGGLALGWVAVKLLDATPANMAQLAFSQLIAAFLAAPVSGVIVDRYRRRLVMIGADVTRAVALLTVPLAHRNGWLSVGWLMAVGAITSASSVAFNSAYGAHLRQLVGAPNLVQAHATTAATVSIAEITGFASAGWMSAWFGATNAVMVDAASFIVSALCILWIATPEPRRIARGESRRRPPSFTEASAGARFAFREPVLRSLLGSAALCDTALGLSTASYMLYLSADLGFGDGLLGSVFAIGGLTSLVGARWATRAERAGNVGRSMAIAGAIRTVGVAAMPAAFNTGGVSTGLLVANQVVTDPAWMLQEIGEGAVRQSRTPDDMAGRIAAAHQLAGSSGRLVGTTLALVVGTSFGPRWSLWCGVLLCAVATAWLALSPAGRVTRAADPPLESAAVPSVG